MPLFRFSDDDAAVLMANDTEYGLAAYFYTRDLRRAWTLAERLEYGMVRFFAGLVGWLYMRRLRRFWRSGARGAGRERGATQHNHSTLHPTPLSSPPPRPLTNPTTITISTTNQIGINEVAITSEVAPFGGVKQSGLGREQGRCVHSARAHVFVRQEEKGGGCLRQTAARCPNHRSIFITAHNPSPPSPPPSPPPS